jgi:hypothetical protein
MRGHPWRRQIDQLGLAQLLVASAPVFELFWWPCRCFSQAWAPKPNSSTVAIRVAVNRRCMAEKVSFHKPRRDKLGKFPWIGGFGLDFVTIAMHCCSLLAPDPLQMQQLPLFRRSLPGRARLLPSLEHRTQCRVVPAQPVPQLECQTGQGPGLNVSKPASLKVSVVWPWSCSR